MNDDLYHHLRLEIVVVTTQNYHSFKMYNCNPHLFNLLHYVEMTTVFLKKNANQWKECTESTSFRIDSSYTCSCSWVCTISTSKITEFSKFLLFTCSLLCLWENDPSHSRWYGFPSMIFPRLRSTWEFNNCSSVNTATLQEPDYAEFYYTCTLTTGTTKDTVPSLQRVCRSRCRPENCTTNRERAHSSRLWDSKCGTKRHNWEHT